MEFTRNSAGTAVYVTHKLWMGLGKWRCSYKTSHLDTKHLSTPYTSNDDIHTIIPTIYKTHKIDFLGGHFLWMFIRTGVQTSETKRTNYFLAAGTNCVKDHDNEINFA